MRALITGVTGFVGSHLAQHLVASGDEVIGISQTGTWPDDAPETLRRDVPVFTSDIAVELTPQVRHRIADWAPEIVYHLAAISVPADCGADEPTAAAITTNVVGTRALVEFVLSLRDRPRVLYSGSCYVYGVVPPDNPVVSEETLCDPYSGYGVTKLAAEQTLLSAARDRQLDVVIARAFQHTGPRQSPRMIVPDWARQLTTPGDEPVRVICRDTFLDLSDVRDITRAYRLLAIAGGSGRVYNVGSGVCRRSGDLLDRMRRLCDSSKLVLELSPGRRQHPIANITRIADEIGWRPMIPIDRTLHDVLHYWQHASGVSP